MLHSILSCLNGRRTPAKSTQSSALATGRAEKYRDAYTSEKEAMTYAARYSDDKRPMQGRTAEDTAEHLLAVLQAAKEPGPELQRTLDGIVHAEAGGWRKSIARALLAGIEATIRAGRPLSGPLQRAFDKAYAKLRDLKEIADEHPVLEGVVLSIVALAVLYLLWPVVLEVLGFGELGPIEGEW